MNITLAKYDPLAYIYLLSDNNNKIDQTVSEKLTKRWNFG